MDNSMERMLGPQPHDAAHMMEPCIHSAGSTSPSSRKLQSLADTDQQGNQEYFGRVRVAGLRGNQMLSGAFLHQVCACVCACVCVCV
eukprot:1161659-Pelagomonas_calceolata.AAC.23